MSLAYGYTFPALRGVQAGRSYYVAMCPLKVLPKLFMFDDVDLPPELRAQRKLNMARIPEMSHYILDNRHEYAFSAITASIDSEVTFEPFGRPEQSNELDIGQLTVPITARFIINDGQHRRAAIEKAIEEQPDLGAETIAVVLYTDVGLKRTQQLFADLNKHAVRPTRSLGILYDYRDSLAQLARELTASVPYFIGMVETEKTTISNRSMKLFTLNGIYEATSALLSKRKGDTVTRREARNARAFWTELGKVIPEWQFAAKRQVSTAELRRDYVHSHSVALHAIGMAGHALLQQHPDDWKTRLTRLGRLDWRRTNDVWAGRAMLGGQMSKARQNVRLTSIYLKKQLGLKLTDDECNLDC